MDELKILQSENTYRLPVSTNSLGLLNQAMLAASRQPESSLIVGRRWPKHWTQIQSSENSTSRLAYSCLGVGRDRWKWRGVRRLIRSANLSLWWTSRKSSCLDWEPSLPSDQILTPGIAPLARCPSRSCLAFVVEDSRYRSSESAARWRGHSLHLLNRSGDLTHQAPLQPAPIQLLWWLDSIGPCCIEALLGSVRSLTRRGHLYWARPQAFRWILALSPSFQCSRR